MERTDSQCRQIAELLKAGKSITPAEAYESMGCLRLAARISDLKERGMDITDEWVEIDDKRFKKYFLRHDA